MVTEMAARGGEAAAFGASEADRGDFEVFRSGSAPPTVEGALGAAAGGLLVDDELRSDPAYQSYYYSNAHLNPRLPPPLLSKEDWRSSHHRLRSSAGFGGIGDGRRQQQQQASAAEGTVGLPGIDLGRQRSFSSVFQVERSNRIFSPLITSFILG